MEPLNFLSVLAVGSQVNVGGIRAVVTAVIIRESGHVTYEVVWWANGMRNCVTVEAWEAEVAEVKRIGVGFHPHRASANGPQFPV